MKPEELKKFKENEEKIYNILRKRSGDVNKYLNIKKLFNENKIDEIFEKEYRQFYRLNRAGLTKEHFEAYFDLLRNKEEKLEKILMKLYNIKTSRGYNSIQISFTTKLLHTIDNTLPIYDKHIGIFFGIKNPNDIKSLFNTRIKKRIEMYEKLKDGYKELLDNKQISHSIKKCRKEFGWSDDDMTDLKILDFMLWANGQVK